LRRSDSEDFVILACVGVDRTHASVINRRSIYTDCTRVYTHHRSIPTAVLHSVYTNHVFLCNIRRHAWSECEIAQHEQRTVLMADKRMPIHCINFALAIK